MGYLASLSESSLLIPVKTDVPDSFNNNVAIKRRIGLFSASTFVVGAIVGSGIFVSPIGVLRFTGSVGGALSVWVGTGILSTVGALCYVELGTTFQQSGSDYTYMRLCFGDLFAFLYLWVYMLIIGPAGNAIAALTFANYVLEPFFPYCIIPQDAIRMIATLIICK